MPQLGAAGPDRPRQQSPPCWSQKLQSALQKSRIDRATTRPTAEGWTLSTGTGLYGACRSTHAVLSGCVVLLDGCGVQYGPRWL